MTRKNTISDKSAPETTLGAQKSETKEEEAYALGTFVMGGVKDSGWEPCRVLSSQKKSNGFEYSLENSEGRRNKCSDRVDIANADQKGQWIKERKKLFSDCIRLESAAFRYAKLFNKPLTVDALLDNMCEGIGEVDENKRSVYRNKLVDSIKNSNRLVFDEEAETISLKSSASSPATTSAHAQSAGMATDKASSAAPQGITKKTETARLPANRNSSSESNGTQQGKRHDAAPSQEVDVEKIRSTPYQTAYQEGYKAAEKEHEEAIKKNRDKAHEVEYKKAEGYIEKWRATRSPRSHDIYRHHAEMLNDVITPAPTDPKVAQVVHNFLQTSDNDPNRGHPLFHMISAAKSQEQKRFLISLLNIDTLEHYARWLDHQPQDSTQTRPLIGGLSELLSRLYDISSKPREYRRLCDLMKKLIKRLPEDDQESYYWRLFSFVRESWSRLAPKANEGDNDMEAVEEFLTWLPDFAKSMPDALRTTLLVSLMLDVTFVRVYTSIRTSVLDLCVHHVLDAESSEQHLRLTALRNLLPASAKEEFLERYDFELLQKRDQ